MCTLIYTLQTLILVKCTLISTLYCRKPCTMASAPVSPVSRRPYRIKLVGDAWLARIALVLINWSSAPPHAIPATDLASAHPSRREGAPACASETDHTVCVCGEPRVSLHCRPGRLFFRCPRRIAGPAGPVVSVSWCNQQKITAFELVGECVLSTREVGRGDNGPRGATQPETPAAIEHFPRTWRVCYRGRSAQRPKGLTNAPT